MGKTALASELVQHLPADIISVDSAMVYRGMDIGTAKPSHTVLKLAPHWLIDIRDPAEPYSVADFCSDARRKITTILAQGRIPLLVGGTMLYFRALQHGLSALPPADLTVRERLNTMAEQHGWSSLYAYLLRVDPAAAARIHPHDSQRLQRALEVYEITGQPFSALQQIAAPSLSAEWKFINLVTMPTNRCVLHQKIAQRFEQMLALGLLDEVKTLFLRNDLNLTTPAMRAVGYQQIWRYLNGEYDVKVMGEKVLVATRQLAKHQMTWLRSWRHTHLLSSSPNAWLDQTLSFLRRSDGLG